MKRKGLILAAAFIMIVVFLAGCTLPASIEASAKSTAAPSPEAAATTVDSDKMVVQLEQPQDKNSVTVSATGTIKVTPDVAYTTVGVVTQKKKMQDAQSSNRDLMNAVVEALKKAGLKDDDIRTTNYSVYPVYDYMDASQKITAFEVNNTVELTIRDIDKVGEVLDAAAAAGANTSYSVTFDLQDKSPSYNKALTAAMESARSKADTLAAAGKFTIKGVLNVSEGYSNTPVYYEYPAAAEDSSKAPTYINSGNMDVTATVTVIFEIL
jgi:uncharacterized protein YggE